MVFWRVVRGDVRSALTGLAAGSVQTCITSPPYWKLRDYGHEDQIGSEPTVDAYVATMVHVFREVRRVLRDDGTLWLNLGDTYADKQLQGIPWRVALALQADGWCLRCDVIWSKPSPMPESVSDRPTRSHEYVFLLAKRGEYFFDQLAIVEPGAEPDRQLRNEAFGGKNGALVRHGAQSVVSGTIARRNKRSVWTITPQPCLEAHFATFPELLVEPCVLAGTSAKGQCRSCGAPWSREIVRASGMVRDREVEEGLPSTMSGHGIRQLSGSEWRQFKEKNPDAVKPWAPTCQCQPSEPVPQVVLDPFAGSGTTGVVAVGHQRSFIGIELNAEYRELARRRIACVAPLFTNEVVDCAIE